MFEPKVAKQPPKGNKQCSRCQQLKSKTNFPPSKSIFFSDDTSPICADCLISYLNEREWNWEAINKICQYLDIPFIPNEFHELYVEHQEGAFLVYCKMVSEGEYESLGWGEYFEEYKRLRNSGLLENEIPLVREKRMNELRDVWGHNYDDEEILYLENLYVGLQKTQNINGALQIDQARKLCKISLNIDDRIKEGEDFDKLMSSYDRMVKTAEFTPKNVKNENDFDSFGEVVAWLEKRGFVNSYFDDVSKDIVDEVISNLQNFNQRLYIEESGAGSQVEDKIEALKAAQALQEEEDSLYDVSVDDFKQDLYDNEGYEKLRDLSNQEEEINE